MRAIGKSGARSAGPIGWPVPGWKMGAGGIGRSAAMLYQAFGIWSSESRNLVFRSSPRAFVISVVLPAWSADGAHPWNRRSGELLLEPPGRRLKLLEVLRQAATGLFCCFAQVTQLEDSPVANDRQKHLIAVDAHIVDAGPGNLGGLAHELRDSRAGHLEGEDLVDDGAHGRGRLDDQGGRH